MTPTSFNSTTTSNEIIADFLIVRETILGISIGNQNTLA
jgi:hypothetical protein